MLKELVLQRKLLNEKQDSASLPHSDFFPRDRLCGASSPIPVLGSRIVVGLLGPGTVTGGAAVSLRLADPGQSAPRSVPARNTALPRPNTPPALHALEK